MNKVIIFIFLASFSISIAREEYNPIGFVNREEVGMNDPKFNDYFDNDGFLNLDAVDGGVRWVAKQFDIVIQKINDSFKSTQSQIDDLVRKMNRPVVSTVPNLEEVTTVGSTAKDSITVPSVITAGGLLIGKGHLSDSYTSISCSGEIIAEGNITSTDKGKFYGGLEVGSDLSAGEGRASDFYESIYIIGSGNKLDVDGNADIRGSTISLGNSGTGIMTVESSTTFKKAMSMNNKRIVSIATPEQGSDAATKSYVDSHFTNSITILVVSQSGNNIVLTPMRIKADAVLDQAFQTITLSSSQLLSDVRYVDGVNGSLRKTSMTALVINAASSNDVEIIATKEVQSVTP